MDNRSITRARSWFDVPGIGVLGGARLYLLPDAPPAALPDEPDAMLEHVSTPPPGRVVYSEGRQ